MSRKLVNIDGITGFTAIVVVVLAAGLTTSCTCTFPPPTAERWCFEAPGAPTTWICAAQTHAQCVAARARTAGTSSLTRCQRAERYCYSYTVEGLYCYSTRVECRQQHGAALCEPAD